MSDSTALARTALEEAGAVVTDTSLQFENPAALTWEEYERLGFFLGGIGRGYPWWVGDFLNAGEDVFGEKFAQIEAALPHSPQTCANYKSVAKHIPSERRRGLHMSVAAEAAYLPPRERAELLNRAAKGDWKREEMREAAKALRAEMAGLPPAVDVPQTPKTKCPSCGHEWRQ